MSKLTRYITIYGTLAVAVTGLAVWLFWPRRSVTQSTDGLLPIISPSPITSATLSIENMAFTPATFIVKKGTTVVWINQDSVSHSVVFENGSHVDDDEKVFAYGQSYQVTFNEVGTFSYHCGVHPGMHGSIVVQL